MLKGVKKGIKKKIKGKKDKKEDDLFDPEQLEKYKRELEEAKKARQQDEESGSTAAGSSGGHEDDEEWLRFKQLTSGVDALVNKASDDLDKIKESSFFQRNKPSEQNRLFARPKDPVIVTPEQEKPPEGSKWVHIEGAGAEHEEVTEADGAAAFGTDTTDDAFNTAAQVPESPAEIIPVELDDSLFDTTFTDAIAAGEIKLAYIPDSPTPEDEDDPFSTKQFDDVVKKIEEEEKRQAKQVNLGGAVDYLTGKGDKTGIARPRTKAAETKAKARPRPHAVNLLGDFDAMPPSAPVQSSSAGSNAERPKDIFDQILDSPSREVTIDIMASREIQRKKDSDEGSKEDKGIKDVISEFDIISQLDPIISGSSEAEPLPSGVPSSIPSSIAALLTTSTAPPEEDDDLDDEFAALAAESIHKGPSPANIVPTTEAEEEPAVDEDDPFCTDYVDKLAAHGKCELKILENEFLGDVTCEKGEGGAGGGDEDDFDFNPRLGESKPKTLKIQNAPKMNPLEDMSPMTGRAVPTIEPQVKAVGPTLVETSEGEAGGNEDLDPFDTTNFGTALPGKAELKLLEAELLSSVEQPKVQPPKLPDAITSVLIKNQEPTQDNDEEFDLDFNPRKDEFKHHPLDLPDIGVDNVDTASKVLTPQLDIEVEMDPFSTEFVSASGLIPGPLELKLLESELVSPMKEAPVSIVPVQQAPVAPVKFPRTFSDENFDNEFDPREGKPAPPLAIKPPQTTEELFDSTMDFAVDKPMTPQQEMPSTAIPEPKLCPVNVEDPFDTSGIQIENYLAKSELKQVEEELLNAPPDPVRQTIRQLPVIVAVEYKHPQPIVPEIQPEPEILHPFEANTPVDDSFKPLTPVEMSSMMSGVISVFNPVPMADPFNTDFVPEGLIPGKTEIKLLEEELGVTAGLERRRRLSDPDFDPRGQPKHPSNQMVSHPLTPMPAQPSKAPVVADGSDPFVTTSETVMPGLRFLPSNPFHNDNVDNIKIPMRPDLPCVPLHISNPFRTSQSIAAINEKRHFPSLPQSYGMVDVNNNNPFLFPNFASQNPR